MILKKLGFLATVSGLGAVPAFAGDKVLYGDPPAWVTPIKAPQVLADSDAATLPIRVILVDNQQKLDGDRREEYSRALLRFQTPEGLSGGNVSFPWRQDNDELTVNQVVIHRGGKVIDVLKSGQTFTVLRREQNLEQATLDGILTANMFPEGLQVGDELEIATTLVSRDAVLAGHGSASFGPLNGRVDLAHVQILWPTGNQMRLRKSADLPEWKRRSEGGLEHAELTVEHLEPVSIPDNAPIRFHMVRFAEASDFASWSSLADVFAPLYRSASQIPSDGPLREEVTAIKSASADPVKRAEAALALVEERIRYVALAMGEGGLLPADASQTWARRYGDCKAKTALLLGILSELGIKAEPVVVNTIAGDTLADRLPSAAAFNHVIVRAHIAGRDYWLDGTRIGDSSLARLQVPYFNWGLPIVPGAQLVRMVPAPLSEPSEDLEIHFDATNGVRAPVPATLQLTLRGDDAIGARQGLANLVGDARDKALREYWRNRFDFVEPAKVGMEFNDAKGELLLTLQGTAKLDWDGQWYETDDTRVGYRANFKREPGVAHDAPFAVSYPTYTRTRETIDLPLGFATSVNPSANVSETVAGIEYKRSAALTGQTFFVERTARSVLTEFPAADAPAAQQRLKDLYDKVVYLRLPDGYRLTAADLATTLATTPDNAKDLLAQGNELLNSNKLDEAASRFMRATELEPGNALAWADLGFTLARLEKLAAADAALEKAVVLDPKGWVAFNGRGLVAQQRRDYASAVRAYDKALELNPQNNFAKLARLHSLVTGGKVDQALAELAEQKRKDPARLETYSLIATTLMDSGRRSEVPAAIEELVKANPKQEEQARRIAGSLYTQFGFPEKARELLGNDAPAMNALAFVIKASNRGPLDIEGRLLDYSEALKVEPDNIPARMARAQTYFSAGRFDEALADSAEIIRNDKKAAEAYLLRANIFSKLDRKEQALAEAEAVVAANPDHAWSYAAAGRIYGFFEMRTEAVAALDRAVALNPTGGYYVDRNYVRQKNDYATRLADVDQALAHVPGDPIALYAKAEILTAQGNHKAAAQVYSALIEKGPANADLVTARALSLARANERTAADKDFDEARALAKDAFALNNICYAKAKAGIALERALGECDDALKLEPNAAAIVDSRGLVLLRMGKLDEAIVDFNKALQDSPTMAPSLYGRAIAWSRKGEAKKAKVDEEAALKADPRIAERFAEYGISMAIDRQPQAR